MARAEPLCIAARAVESGPNQVGRRPSRRGGRAVPLRGPFPGSWPIDIPRFDPSALRAGGVAVAVWGRRRPPVGRPALFGNSDVGTSMLGPSWASPRGGAGEGPNHARPLRDRRESTKERMAGEWHTPHHSFTPGMAARPAGAKNKQEQEPFEIQRDPIHGPGPAAASRDAAARSRAETRPAELDSALLPGRRGSDRRGQARKGAGGMPRRHQRFERGRPR